MGKLFVAHRIVVRDAQDRIVSEEPFDDFVQAMARYPEIVLSPGEEVALQHGARIIKKRSYEPE